MVGSKILALECYTVNSSVHKVYWLIDPLTDAKRDSCTLMDALEMTCCRKLPDSNSQATQIRSTLTDMFWREREGSELKWTS